MIIRICLNLFLFFFSCLPLLATLDIGEYPYLKKLLEIEGFEPITEENSPLISASRCENVLLKNKQEDSFIYLLKNHPHSSIEENLLIDQFHYQDFLAKKGIPVLLPKKINGKSYLRISSKDQRCGKFFSILEFKQSFRSSQLSQLQIKEMGELLSNMHHYSMEINFIKDLPYFGKKSFFSDIKMLLSNAVDEYQSKYPNLSKGAYKEWKRYILWASESLENSESEAKKSGYYDNLIPIHGDFHQNNVLFGKSNIIAVIDFDNACLGSPLEDLIRCCLHFLVFTFDSPLKFTEDKLLDSNDFYEFINGYIFEFSNVNFAYPLAKMIVTQLVTIYYLRGIQTGVIEYSKVVKFIDKLSERITSMICDSFACQKDANVQNAMKVGNY